jgi:hypothetical protein
VQVLRVWHVAAASRELNIQQFRENVKIVKQPEEKVEKPRAHVGYQRELVSCLDALEDDHDSLHFEEGFGQTKQRARILQLFYRVTQILLTSNVFRQHGFFEGILPTSWVLVIDLNEESTLHDQAPLYELRCVL